MFFMPDMLAKTPAEISRMPFALRDSEPVHAAALHEGLRVRVPLDDTKKPQLDDVHVVT
jgi:hypothetical protein